MLKLNEYLLNSIKTNELIIPISNEDYNKTNDIIDNLKQSIRTIYLR